MAWRLAKSLDVLFDEVNKRAPDRSKASDGTIGDDSHQDRPSDHNPNGDDVVCAGDFTHDPDAGADMDKISDILAAKIHPAVKYIIFNRLIWTRDDPHWRDYNGSNPHTVHMHVSVGRGPDGESTGPYDDTSSWGVAKTEPEDPGDFPLPKGYYFGPEGEGNESVSGWHERVFSGKTDREWLKLWAKQLGKDGWEIGKGKKYLPEFGNDGMYGDEWVTLIKAFQKKEDLSVDGLIGPKTWKAAF